MKDSCENSQNLGILCLCPDLASGILSSPHYSPVFVCTPVPISLAPQVQNDWQDANIKDMTEKNLSQQLHLNMLMWILDLMFSNQERPRPRFRCDTLSLQFKS